MSGTEQQSHNINSLDRDLQKRMLEALIASYPDNVVLTPESLGISEKKRNFNLSYLVEHGLVKQVRDPSTLPIYKYYATHKGIDFLQQDGGLSAILGVVTIKLHDDTIKSLIEARIMQSDLPQPDKRRYLDALRELPAETTKHLVLKLVDMGLDHKDAAISAIGKLIGLG